jgi:hypothetical protein
VTSAFSLSAASFHVHLPTLPELIQPDVSVEPLTFRSPIQPSKRTRSTLSSSASVPPSFPTGGTKALSTDPRLPLPSLARRIYRGRSLLWSVRTSSLRRRTSSKACKAFGYHGRRVLIRRMPNRCTWRVARCPALLRCSRLTALPWTRTWHARKPLRAERAKEVRSSLSSPCPSLRSSGLSI